MLIYRALHTFMGNISSCVFADYDTSLYDKVKADDCEVTKCGSGVLSLWLYVFADYSAPLLSKIVSPDSGG